jgi:hypothetical protein
VIDFLIKDFKCRVNMQATGLIRLSTACANMPCAHNVSFAKSSEVACISADIFNGEHLVNQPLFHNAVLPLAGLFGIVTD